MNNLEQIIASENCKEVHYYYIIKLIIQISDNT